jgi:hypothetical protein
MTIEMASDLVLRSNDVDERFDLYCKFEEELNPHPIKINGEWNEKSVEWQKMFASLCGFGIATNIKLM